MFAKRLLAVLVPAILASTAAHAGIALIGKGTLSGADLSGLTNTLENGVAANILGGMGSGIAWAGGSTFLLTPDRGPNASAWNAAVVNTTSWIPRYQTVDLGLSAATFSTVPKLGLPSRDRALYRPSRVSPESRASWLMLRARAATPNACVRNAGSSPASSKQASR